MLTCKSCGAALDLAMSACPECLAEVELGRLTGILGIVCRACDAYNDPGARACVSCGQPIGASAARAAAPATAHASAAPAAPSPPPPPPSQEPPLLTPLPMPSALQLAPTPPPAAAPAPGEAPPPFAPTPRPATPAAPGAPVLLSFQRGVAGPTRVIPLVRSADGGALSCPRCGGAAGPGRFCQRCGQPLGPRAAPVPRAAPAAGAEAVEPAAASTGRARIHLEHGEGPEGTSFKLTAEVAEAGRTRGPISFPADPCLAPHHATFFFRDGSLHVRDEGAVGGIYLRLRGPSAPIRPGDLFAVGDRLLRFGGLLPPAPPGPADGTRRLGAPRHGGPTAVVEEWLEGGIIGRVFVRAGPSITIGRAGCAISLGDDPYLSQAHAELVLEAHGMARLRDLGSANGTYLRVPSRAERELHDGDGLRLGREVLRVSIA